MKVFIPGDPKMISKKRRKNRVHGKRARSAVYILRRACKRRLIDLRMYRIGCWMRNKVEIRNPTHKWTWYYKSKSDFKLRCARCGSAWTLKTCEETTMEKALK